MPLVSELGETKNGPQETELASVTPASDEIEGARLQLRVEWKCGEARKLLPVQRGESQTTKLINLMPEKRKQKPSSYNFDTAKIGAKRRDGTDVMAAVFDAVTSVGSDHTLDSSTLTDIALPRSKRTLRRRSMGQTMETQAGGAVNGVGLEALAQTVRAELEQVIAKQAKRSANAEQELQGQLGKMQAQLAEMQSGQAVLTEKLEAVLKAL